MEKLVIEGGKPLSGAISIHGAKNAALPILAASIMAEGTVKIENVPDLSDIGVMLGILRSLGCKVELAGDTVIVNTNAVHQYHIPESLMSQMRSSIFLMGPLLARLGKVELYQPGGCAIGERKIDLHLKGLAALGVVIEDNGSRIVCTAKELVGADIVLDYPSVGATENIMMQRRWPGEKRRSPMRLASLKSKICKTSLMRWGRESSAPARIRLRSRAFRNSSHVLTGLFPIVSSQVRS